MAIAGGIGKLRFLIPKEVEQSPNSITGPIPPLVSNACFPQVVDIGLVAGYALVIAASQVHPGGSPGSETHHGTHAVTLAQAEGEKTVTFNAVKTPPAITGILGTFVSVGQQYYVDWNGEVVPSVVAGQTPPVIESIYGAPQQIDLTQQGFITKSTVAAILPTGPVLPIVSGVPPQQDLTQQGFVTKSTSSTLLTGPVIPRIVGKPEEIDLTQQGSIFHSVFEQFTGSFGPASYRYGGHAVDVATAEGQKTKVWEAIQIGGSAPILGPSTTTWLKAGPQVIDLTQQAVLSKPLIGTVPLTGPIIKYINSNTEDSVQLTDYILESLTSPAPPILGIYADTVSQFEDRSGGKIWKTSVAQAGGSSGFVSKYITTPVDNTDTSIAYILESLASPPIVLLGETFITSPQNEDRFYSVLFKPVPTPLPTSGILGKFSVGFPQAIDLTQQGSIFKPFPGPLPTNYAKKQVYGTPEYIDLTQQAKVFVPLVLGTPAPPVSTGSSRAHKEERFGIDWSIPFSFQQAVQKAEQTLQGKEVSVKKLPSQPDLDYYSNLIVALEKKIEYYNNQLEHLHKTEKIKALKRSEKIKTMLSVLEKAKTERVLQKQIEDDEDDAIEAIMLIFEMED